MICCASRSTSGRAASMAVCHVFFPRTPRTRHGPVRHAPSIDMARDVRCLRAATVCPLLPASRIDQYPIALRGAADTSATFPIVLTDTPSRLPANTAPSRRSCSRTLPATIFPDSVAIAFGAALTRCDAWRSAWATAEDRGTRSRALSRSGRRCAAAGRCACGGCCWFVHWRSAIALDHFAGGRIAEFDIGFTHQRQ